MTSFMVVGTIIIMVVVAVVVVVTLTTLVVNHLTKSSSRNFRHVSGEHFTRDRFSSVTLRHLKKGGTRRFDKSTSNSTRRQWRRKSTDEALPMMRRHQRGRGGPAVVKVTTSRSGLLWITSSEDWSQSFLHKPSGI